jgi:hypothetical protein
VLSASRPSKVFDFELNSKRDQLVEAKFSSIGDKKRFEFQFEDESHEKDFIVFSPGGTHAKTLLHDADREIIKKVGTKSLKEIPLTSIPLNERSTD